MSAHKQVYRPSHPRASASGMVYEHVVIAERALGKLLPPGSNIHHVDGNKRNNANRNLVICQDMAYHKLLHVRARVVKAGGDPNTERVCSTCSQPRPFAAFNKCSASRSDGLQQRCRACQSTYWKTYRPPSKRAAA